MVNTTSTEVHIRPSSLNEIFSGSDIYLNISRLLILKHVLHITIHSFKSQKRDLFFIWLEIIVTHASSNQPARQMQAQTLNNQPMYLCRSGVPRISSCHNQEFTNSPAWPSTIFRLTYPPRDESVQYTSCCHAHTQRPVPGLSFIK